MTSLVEPHHATYAAPAVPLSFLALAIVGVLYLLGFRKYTRPIALGLYFVVVPAAQWVWQFELSQRGSAGWVYVINAVQVVAFSSAWLGWLAIRRVFLPGYTAAFAVWLVSQLLQYFSYIYWSYGTTRDFNHTLSHLDSLYFAIGTLTTAGTGGINATSELSIRLQLIQMGLDFALIAGAIALLFVRYSVHFADRGPSRR